MMPFECSSNGIHGTFQWADIRVRLDSLRTRLLAEVDEWRTVGEQQTHVLRDKHDAGVNSCSRPLKSNQRPYRSLHMDMCMCSMQARSVWGRQSTIYMSKRSASRLRHLTARPSVRRWAIPASGRRPYSGRPRRSGTAASSASSSSFRRTSPMRRRSCASRRSWCTRRSRHTGFRVRAHHRAVIKLAVRFFRSLRCMSPAMSLLRPVM